MSKKLTELIAGLNARHSAGAKDAEIKDITSDSRKAGKGALFIARRGDITDGHKYIPQALEAGAAAILCQTTPLNIKIPTDVSFYEVAEPRRIAGRIAARLYDHPAEALKMLCVTGTNGKTTISYIDGEIVKVSGLKVGIIGTIGYHSAHGVLPALHTTPEGEVFQKLIHEMREGGIKVVAAEFSSHALKQGRLSGATFDVAAFTNLSRDHLDFHIDFEDYYQSKKLLFTDYLKPHATAVINIDDETGKRLFSEIACKKLSVSLKKTARADIRPLKYNISISGITATVVTPIGEFELLSPLVGSFNLSNLLMATGVAIAGGFGLEDIAEGVARSEGAPGRLDRVVGNCGAVYFIDYAHTPDALKRVTGELRRLSQGKLIVVFGCGGDRDNGKRPLMGEEAAKLADVTIVTSDNPRTENPDTIIDMIVPGIEKTGAIKTDIDNIAASRSYIRIANRGDAIAAAVKIAGEGDIVLIAGKGHESYQEINGKRNDFSDKLKVEKALAAREKEECK